VADPGFQYATWAGRFPALAAEVPETVAQSLYTEALLIPEGSQIVNSCVLQTPQIIIMMNLLVAHLAYLSTVGASQVGRIGQASEGSVSVSFDYPAGGAEQSWFNQSTYGAQLWVMMGPLRRGRYVPGPAVNQPALGLSLAPNVWPGNGGFGGPGRGYGGW
jgi:hypothetical protein